MSSCSSCLCSFIFTGPARICDVTMSHTSIYIVGARKRPYFLTFSFIFARFGRFACFGRFGGFGGFVSVVSMVSFRSFRSFRWFRFGRFVSLFRVLVHAEKHAGLEFSFVIIPPQFIPGHQELVFKP